MRRLVLAVAASVALAGCDGVDGPTAVQSPALQAASSAAQASGAQFQDVIVTFKSHVADPSGLANGLVGAHGGSLKHIYLHTIRGFAASLPEQAITALQNNPDIELIEPDAIATLVTTVVPSNSWGLDRVDQTSLPLNDQYSYDYDGSGVYAYILDTGIRISHNEFGGRASHGYDFIDDDPFADDCHSHGTHVAGTVGGELYGVAKDVNLVAVRVLNCGGSGTYSGIIAAVDWVKNDAVSNNRTGVANMSIGGGVSTSLNNAIDAAVDAGVVFAVSAGNESTDACTRSPASATDALTVGSTTSSDNRSSFSNYGTCVDLFAPGSSITSAIHTSDSATGVKSGTSMSSPHVAGAVALYREQFPGQDAHAVNAGVTGAATAGVVGNPGSGSPNLLLYTFFDGSQPPPPTVTQVTVSDMTVYTSGNKRRRGNAEVLVTRVSDGAPVAGATVSGTWSGDYSGSDSGVTGSDGVALIQSPNRKNASTFNFCVDDVTGSNLEYVGSDYDCGGTPPPPPPPAGAPTDLSVTYKTKGKKKATLTWTPGSASLVDIYRDGALRAGNQSNDGHWSENTSLQLQYQVCADGPAPGQPGAQCSNLAGGP